MKKWILMIAVALMGCKTSSELPQQVSTEPTLPALMANTWQMVEYVQNGETKTLPAEVPVLEFLEHHKIAGSGACNRLMGGYELTGGNGLIIRLSGRTMAFCPDMPFEDAYVSALEQIEYASVENGIMTLKDGNNTITIKYKAVKK